MQTHMDQILLSLTAGAGLALAILTIIYLSITRCCKDSHWKVESGWDAIQNSSGDECKTSIAVADSQDPLSQLQPGDPPSSSNSWTILSPAQVAPRREDGDSRFRAWLRASEQCVALVPVAPERSVRPSSGPGSRPAPGRGSQHSFRAMHVMEPHCDEPVDCLVSAVEMMDSGSVSPVKFVDRMESESCVAIDIQDAWSPRDADPCAVRAGAGKPMDSAQSMAIGGHAIQHESYGCIGLMVYDRSKQGECRQKLHERYGVEICSRGVQCGLNNHLDEGEDDMVNAGLTPLRQPIGAIPDFPVMLEHKPTVSVMSLSQRMASLS